MNKQPAPNTKLHMIKFVDAFSFAQEMKQAYLTDGEIEYINRCIKAHEVVHTHHDKANGIVWNWIPVKLIDPATPEGQAELTLYRTSVSIF